MEIPKKKCKICGKEQTVENSYVYKNRSGNALFHTYCKVCGYQKNQENNWRKGVKKRIDKSIVFCTSCNSEKTVDEMIVLASGRVLRLCKLCKREYDKKRSEREEVKANRKVARKKYLSRKPEMYSKFLSNTKKQRENRTKALDDVYLCDLIMSSFKKKGITDMRRKDIPRELIEAKRRCLSYKREFNTIRITNFGA